MVPCSASRSVLSLFVRMYMHIYMCIFIYKERERCSMVLSRPQGLSCISLYICIYIFIYIHVNVYIQREREVCNGAMSGLKVCLVSLDTYMYIYTYMYAHTHIYTYICIYVYVYIYIYISI